MKSKLFYFLPVLLGLSTIATAASNGARFKKEVRDGLDITTWDTGATERPYSGGHLGMNVYSVSEYSPKECDNSNIYCRNQTRDRAGDTGTDYAIFIPSDMYIRMGGSFNLNFATSRATYGPANLKARSSGTWGVAVGLGWNYTENIRIEGDIQIRNFEFTEAPWSAYDLRARTQSVAATAYFDLLPRYKRTGDLTRPTRLMPFIGVGLSGGATDFDDSGVQPIGFGEGNRSAYLAPRGVLGVSFALSELVNLDIYYQYEMMLFGKFGWQAESGIKNISDVMASFRFNF